MARHGERRTRSWLDRVLVAGGCCLAVVYPLVLIASCTVQAARR